jgi:hypothetical protein
MPLNWAYFASGCSNLRQIWRKHPPRHIKVITASGKGQTRLTDVSVVPCAPWFAPMTALFPVEVMKPISSNFMLTGAASPAGGVDGVMWPVVFSIA